MSYRISNKAILYAESEKKGEATCIINRKGEYKMKCECIKTTNIVLEAGKKITLNTGAINQTNLNDFCLVIAQSIPKDAKMEQVFICPTNAPSYALNSVSGNYIRIDQLRCRKSYPVVFGNDPNHYSLKVKVANTGYEVV